MKRITRVNMTGGALGPLTLGELRAAKKGIDLALENDDIDLSDAQKVSLDKLNEYIAHVVKDKTSVGRIV